MATINGICSAESPIKGRGAYLGLFGGGGSLSSSSIQQTEIAFSPDGNGANDIQVNAQGTTGNTGASIGGAHVGYEFDDWALGGKETGWSLTPAAEIEGYYLGSNPSSSYVNNPLVTTFDHSFTLTMPLNAGVFLANTILTFRTPYSENIVSYIGGGVGGATLQVCGATDSSQVGTFPEPGLNHFNTNPNATSSAFAATAKAGVRAEVYEHFSLFAEYRYLFINSSNYTFGSTNGALQGYPDHRATTNWNVNLGGQNYNLAVAGFDIASRTRIDSLLTNLLLRVCCVQNTQGVA